MIFIDTNYFLRLLLKDTPQQGEAKSVFLKASHGKLEIFTSIIVVFEIYWVLTSFYGKKKEEIVNILTNVITIPFLEIEDKDVLLKALRIFKENNLDLEDSFNLSYAKASKAIDFLTFDIKLKKLFKVS